ncbi:hypothetical protein MNV49_003469 [Pseudohyphozyma bogoriensis]|nr:hypothetical protein MNV49_003469 [Pseudohyphozyma bogoriensis]
MSTAEPVKKPGAKRGRKQDDSLPPSRSREIQRAFRARKVEQLASLQARVKKLEEENAILRQRLGDPPRENTPEPASSTSSSKVATPKKEAEASTPDSSRAGTVGPDEEKDAPWHPDPSAPGDPYAGLFDPAGVQWPAQQTIPLPQQHLLSPGMGFPPPHNALPPPSSTPFAQLPHLAQLPPMHPAAYPPPPAAFPPSTASNAYWAAFSRLRNPSAPAPADERLFLATSCAVPFTELEHPQPYHHFCLTLLRNLPITGKGRTGRLSHPLSHSGASTPTQDECCAGLLPCPPYEDSPPTAPLSAGYIPALAAWNLISAIPGLSPIDLAGLLIEATKTAGEAGRIRCEVGHGLVIPESGIDGAVKLVEEARKLDRILGAMGPGAGGQGHPHQRQVVEEAYDPQFSFVDVGAANQQS